MKIGVFKFSSCDGCQLAFFDIAPEIINSEYIEISYFLEATSFNIYDRFDVAFVEGSISTREEEERIKDIRDRSKIVVAIGACAVSGGIQSARNFGNFEEIYSFTYRENYFKDINPLSKPISDFVSVDYTVRGCPVNAEEIIEIITSLLLNKTPHINESPVCIECKRKSIPCLLVMGSPCLGPITVDGCGALCPSLNRGCYGCFGPIKGANFESLRDLFKERGFNFEELIKTGFNAYNPYFRGVIWR
ncbi:MAG: Ni/Fe hydrogenase subunit delta [Hydrogenothermaceae bacterium]|nr:Ni/Fe hydrogenase subunit delta [Hydrogenothermaceae bacterium]